MYHTHVKLFRPISEYHFFKTDIFSEIYIVNELIFNTSKN